ncbi:partial Putative teichuronic acid biosynthesis glycosyltransferase TuaC, partial [Rhodocyclaceae bacterium]
PAVTRLIRDTVAGADRLRPVSPLIEGLLKAEGADAARIRLIPSHLVAPRDVLDRLHAERDKVRAAIRTELGIPQDAPLIVTLSGNQKGKGLHILAEAWPAVQAAIPGVRWLFCGPATPWIEEAVWPRLRSAGATEGIVTTNALAGTRVFEHLAAADLHVNPSLCESLNMVTVEAAAVGTPTVGTDGAGIAAWMERYGAGAVVPAGRAAPLADAIIFALKDPARLAAWSAAGREMIAEFTLDRVATQLVALFEHARGPRTEP